MNQILVVDDEPNIRRMIVELLGPLVDKIDTASGGREALALAAEKEYGLVLLDLKMPGMDGLDVLCRLREIRPRVPVIIMTAYGTTQSAIAAVRMGRVLDYLDKPFDPDRLQRMVRHVFDPKQIERQRQRDHAQ
ncbi:MAG: response regulator [Pirellulales bacterium]|nr:response regulator [Pirellulales bacterium]